jgi:hypothetical protein
MERTMRLTAVPQREICMEGHKETGQPYRQILEAPSDESVRSNYKAVPLLVGVTWGRAWFSERALGVWNDSTTLATLRDLQFSYRACRS